MKLLEAEAKQPNGGRSGRARSQGRQRSRGHWFAFGLFAVATTLAHARLCAATTAELNGSPRRLILTVRVFNYAN
jgi:hypothetical protein